RMDAGERRARSGQRRAPRCRRQKRRLPGLPHPYELHAVLPQGHRADLFDRRPEAQSMVARVLGDAVNPKLFVAQRLSAFVLALAVAVHLATILYAVRGGLTAGEILARTHGNPAFALFYAAFVIAVAVHAPIGLRNVLREWTPW